MAILGFFNIATCLPGTRQRVPNSLHSHSPQADRRLCSLARGFSLGRACHHSSNFQHFPVLMGAESGRTHMESPPLHWSSPPQSGPGAFPRHASPSHTASAERGEPLSACGSGSSQERFPRYCRSASSQGSVCFQLTEHKTSPTLFTRAPVFPAALAPGVTTKTSSCTNQLLWRREKLGRYLLLITTFLQVSTKAQLIHAQNKSLYQLLLHPRIWFTDLQPG